MIIIFIFLCYGMLCVPGFINVPLKEQLFLGYFHKGANLWSAFVACHLTKKLVCDILT